MISAQSTALPRAIYGSLPCVPPLYPNIGAENLRHPSGESRKEFFLVLRGNAIGVFTSWETCRKLIGQDDSLWHLCTTWNECVTLWQQKCDAGFLVPHNCPKIAPPPVPTRRAKKPFPTFRSLQPQSNDAVSTTPQKRVWVGQEALARLASLPGYPDDVDADDVGENDSVDNEDNYSIL
ncbi:hypothetical protein BDZ89DRAFT_1052990 [Hymenopellis radicata]|nr:hypothetical protein BDZ89DRAFT_1052990 [Hymenopellis radicata]